MTRILEMLRNMPPIPRPRPASTTSHAIPPAELRRRKRWGRAPDECPKWLATFVDTGAMPWKRRIKKEQQG
jgi:hypothetical protein